MSSAAYQIIALSEGTAAWWEWRRTGIGSADAAAILGDKQARSAEELLSEKQDAATPPDRNFRRERSVALERKARAQYSVATGVSVEPRCVQSLARPWQRASLDGLSADGTRAVEIKCGLGAYERAARRQRPPSHHVAQLQHILAVTGLPVVDYWRFVPSRQPLRLEIRRDETYIERLLAAEETFWQRFTAPNADRTG